MGGDLVTNFLTANLTLSNIYWCRKSIKKLTKTPGGQRIYSCGWQNSSKKKYKRAPKLLQIFRMKFSPSLPLSSWNRRNLYIEGLPTGINMTVYMYTILVCCGGLHWTLKAHCCRRSK
jgi:hypothetical protein